MGPDASISVTNNANASLIFGGKPSFFLPAEVAKSTVQVTVCLSLYHHTNIKYQ